MSIRVIIKNPIELGLSANIKQWYKASLLTGNDGDAKTSFPDQSGNGYNFSGNGKLKYVNGYKSLQFERTVAGNGNGNGMLCGNIPYNIDETIITVCKGNNVPTGTNPNPYTGMLRFAGNSSGQNLLRVMDTSSSVMYISSSPGLANIVTYIVEDREGVVVLASRRRSSSAPVITNKLNKQKETALNYTVLAPQPNVTYYIGFGSAITTPVFSFNIFEQIILDKYCTDVEFDQLIRYMAFNNGAKI